MTHRENANSRVLALQKVLGYCRGTTIYGYVLPSGVRFYNMFSCFLICCVVNAELISKMAFVDHVEIITRFRVLNCCPTKTEYKYEPDEAL